jgi:hypothetical protein
VRAALKGVGITGFDANKWGDMVKAIDGYIAEKAIPQN